MTHAHSAFGWCIWDLPALIVLAVIVIIFAVHVYKMKKREKEFEKELAQAETDKIEGQTDKN